MQKSNLGNQPNTRSTVKLHAYLARCGVASRRQAEKLIGQGRVEVNHKIATIGLRINPQKDQVWLDQTLITPSAIQRYFLVDKPKGLISTTQDELGRSTVLSLLPIAVKKEAGRLYPVGRLDKDSEGLLLLTNDGVLAQKMTHPKYEVQKTYHVQLDRKPSSRALAHLHRGVRLKDGLAMVDACETITEGYTEDQFWYEVTVHEGRNRLIRRLWERLGYDVLRLIRVSFGQFQLDQLEGEAWKEVPATDIGTP
ncbi:rRNA pseudouridine synthase [Candidatus Woesebacteria bacterium]|nr:rRNA pseudouridine synthase [Candidatus Woesebacteria bacterium]